MATWRCKECQYEPLSDSVESCPKCGSTRGAEFFRGKRSGYEKCGTCEGSGCKTYYHNKKW